MPGRKIKPYGLACCAAVLAFAMPVAGNMMIRDAAAADQAAAPAPAANPAANAVAAAPQYGLGGWTIPAPVAAPADPQTAATIARGKYLTVAGDCLPCHSVTGGAPFAGGLAMPSPVGVIYSPNITPSKRYGIGNYTDQQFWNVLHNGIAPGSSLLVFPKYIYPSMPYDAYSKLSHADVMAIKTYLESLQPVETPSRPSAIPFPLNIRAPLLGWRILFFHPQPVQYDSSWSPQIRNGAFLVQALAHCSDCHTPRNILLGAETSKFLAGGNIPSQSWYAPNISSSKDNGGIGAWQADTLTNYLHNGGALGPGAPFGPMVEAVQDSLSRLPESDVRDIVAYLQTGTGPQASTMAATAGPAAASGAQVYAENCARCHGDNGEGVANNFPNLAANQAVWDGPPNDLISMVIGGFASWHDNQSAMPAYRALLTDDQIAAVANYVRTSWGNHGVADATSSKVAALRGMTDTYITLDTGSATASYGGQKFNDINGELTLAADQSNCQLGADFGTLHAAAGGIHLSGTCTDGGSMFEGSVTMNGAATPVRLRLNETRSGPYLTAIMLHGNIAGGQPFYTQIALVNRNE